MWPFTTKKTSFAGSAILPFKSGKAFFEYQCEVGIVDLKPKQGIVGLVKKVSLEPETNIQNATLQIASRDGGFETFSQTANGKGDRLVDGDIVIWVPLHPDPILASVYKNDKRSQWMGLIVARVAPEIDTQRSQFRFYCKYT
ncbi:hypothetical protein [Pseudorhodobacter turbinis]|nr:hypothetical protein [Pseudorhodobacter turbinis]